MTLNVEQTRALLEALRLTRDHELSCDEWLEEISTYLEANPAERACDAFRLVREHLDLCPDCREEIKLMIKALEP